MREPLRLTADCNPVPWKSPTLGTRRHGGKVAPTSSPNMEMVTYQNALREQFREFWDELPYPGKVELHWEFSRQLMSYKSASGRMVTKHVCDTTNMVKSSEDAIQPRKSDPWALITNDKNVLYYTARQLAQSKDATPRVNLTVVFLES